MSRVWSGEKTVEESPNPEVTIPSTCRPNVADGWKGVRGKTEFDQEKIHLTVGTDFGVCSPILCGLGTR